MSFESAFGGGVDNFMDVSRETLNKVFGEEKVDNEFHEIVEYIIQHPDEYRQKVLEQYASVKHEDLEICKECGGNCCLRAPCHYSPSDFEDLSYKGLKKTLKKRRYITVFRVSSKTCKSAFRDMKVDFPYFYILRIRTSGTGQASCSAQIDDDDLCVLLTSKGCPLSYEERPMGARLLIPKKEMKCVNLYSIDECLYDWKDHQDVLRKLFKYFEKRERIISILKSLHL